VTSGLIGLSRLSPRQWAGAQITELAADAQPALAEDSVGRHFAVFRRSNGLAYTEQDKGGWSLPVGVPGTQARDSQPALARDASGRLHLAFRRSAGPAPGIYYMTLGTDGAWSAPQRVSGRSADTLPALALTRAAKPPFHIAFLRSGRRSAGIWHATNRRGRWRLERVPRTGRADARPAFGGPALAADSKGRIQLAFARASGRRGIYYALRGARRWRAPRRVTKVAGDRQPALAVAQSGTAQVVFRRTATKRKGLFSLRPARKLRLARVPGTLAADTQPALTFSGGMLKLVFARRTGPKAGIYYDETTPRGRWLAAPERRSLSSADANPALTADASGRVAILFERG